MRAQNKKPTQQSIVRPIVSVSVFLQVASLSSRPPSGNWVHFLRFALRSLRWSRERIALNMYVSSKFSVIAAQRCTFLLLFSAFAPLPLLYSVSDPLCRLVTMYVALIISLG